MSELLLKFLCRIRYPDPAIKVNDTVKINLSTGTLHEETR